MVINRITCFEINYFEISKRNFSAKKGVIIRFLILTQFFAGIMTRVRSQVVIFHKILFVLWLLWPNSSQICYYTRVFWRPNNPIEIVVALKVCNGNHMYSSGLALSAQVRRFSPRGSSKSPIGIGRNFNFSLSISRSKLFLIRIFQENDGCCELTKFMYYSKSLSFKYWSTVHFEVQIVESGIGIRLFWTIFFSLK